MNYSFQKSRVLLFITIIVVYLAIFQIVLGLAGHLRTGLIDFDIYYRYSQILLSGHSPYGPEYTQGIPFNYPPSSFLLFAPFSLLPFITSSLFFTAFSFFSFIFSVYSLLRIYFKQKYLRLLLLALLIQNFPFKFTLVTGQSNLIVLALLIFAFIFDHKKRPVLSGLFWGMATGIKLTPITLFVYFIARKKYLSLLTGILFLLFSNLFFLALQPQIIFYLSSHLPGLLKQSGFVTTLYDHSLRAFFARLGIYSNIFISYSLVFLLLTLSIWKFLNKKTALSNLIFFSQILIITTIGNAFAWQHHFVLTFPAFISAVKIALGKKSWGYWGTLLISAILIGMHFHDIAHPPTTNPFLISHTLIGSLILFFLLLRN